MDNLQRSELDSFNRIADYNEKYKADFNFIEEYQLEKDKFDLAHNSIRNAGIIQTNQGTDQNMSLSVKTLMANVVTKYCLRASVKARYLKNAKLASQLEGSAGQIISAAKINSIEIATNKRIALFNNLNILTNITQDNISEIDHAISAYNAIKDAPTEERQEKKAVATDQLPSFYVEAREAVDSMYDLIYSYFEDTKPELVNEFEEAKHVIITGKHATSITFDCIADDNNTKIQSFTVTNLSKNKVFSSDNSGSVIIAHHLSGHYNFKIEATGCKEIELATIIKQRTNNHFTVRLKKE